MIGGPRVAELPENEAVLFVIGMRINRWRKVRSWFPVLVGIFHETYIVPPEGIESRYANMGPFGLAAAYGDRPRGAVARRTRADLRVGVTEPEYVDTSG